MLSYLYSLFYTSSLSSFNVLQEVLLVSVSHSWFHRSVSHHCSFNNFFIHFILWFVGLFLVIFIFLILFYISFLSFYCLIFIIGRKNLFLADICFFRKVCRLWTFSFSRFIVQIHSVGCCSSLCLTVPSVWR